MLYLENITLQELSIKSFIKHRNYNPEHSNMVLFQYISKLFL